MAAKISKEKLETTMDLLKAELLLKEKKLSEGLSDNEKKLIEAEAIVLQNKISILERDISELGDLEESAKNAKFWASDKKLIEKVIEDNQIGYLVNENKFIYCRDFGRTQSNANFNMIDATGKKSVRFFEQLTKTPLRGADEDRIVSLFQSLKKSYLLTTSSFNREKWNDDCYNQADVIMKFWTQPNFKEAEKYNKDFDILMHCAGGGKKENIDHLEIWPAYKFLYPDRVANTPNIDLGGNPGGNGKGRYVQICHTIFTPVCVIEAVAKEITGTFNANWANAVVIHYDEPEEDELPNSKIKNATGGESQRIERKGIDAYMADRNHSFIFTSNNENGVVKLTGNRAGEDRRYSVLTTDIVMVYYIMETEKCSFEQAKSRVNDIAQLVKDDKEVAKWLAHVILKHNVDKIDVMQPLHGDDYISRFEDQKENIDRAFDKIFPVFQSEGFIPIGLLLNLVRVLTDNDNWKMVNVNKEFIAYLKRLKVVTDSEDRVRIDYTWKGESIVANCKDRQQLKVIKKTGCTDYSTFDYSLVSTSRVINLPITSFTSVLTND